MTTTGEALFKDRSKTSLCALNFNLGVLLRHKHRHDWILRIQLERIDVFEEARLVASLESCEVDMLHPKLDVISCHLN